MQPLRRKDSTDTDADYVMEVDQDDSDDNTDDSDDLGPMTFPCCICETIVFSPKELGMHILEKHCDDTESNKIDYEITF